MAWLGVAWLGLAWLGLACLSLAWLGLACLPFGLPWPPNVVMTPDFLDIPLPNIMTKCSTKFGDHQKCLPEDKGPHRDVYALSGALREVNYLTATTK